MAYESWKVYRYSYRSRALLMRRNNDIELSRQLVTIIGLLILVGFAHTYIFCYVKYNLQQTTTHILSAAVARRRRAG